MTPGGRLVGTTEVAAPGGSVVETALGGAVTPLGNVVSTT